MKDWLVNQYNSSRIGYYLIRPLFFLIESCVSIVPDKTYLQLKFYIRMGYRLNLKNPKTYSEKINVLKLYDRSDLHVQVADKLRVREYIKKKLGEQYLIPLVAVARSAKEINPDQLPDYPVILKTNHNSGGVSIIWDKNKTDWGKVKFKMNKLLHENYSINTREWQYDRMSRCIVVEKLLIDQDGNIPRDYKLYCFNGKHAFTQVDLDRYGDHTRSFYGGHHWERLPFIWGKYPRSVDVPRPEVLPEMIDLAEKIARDFLHARVDFYVVGSDIYFGEVTLHTDSGFLTVRPKKYDREIGDLLNIEALIQQANAH